MEEKNSLLSVKEMLLSGSVVHTVMLRLFAKVCIIDQE